MIASITDMYSWKYFLNVSYNILLHLFNMQNQAKFTQAVTVG